MYDLVETITPRTKVPFTEIITAATGTLTYSSATFTLTNNAGTSIASGSVDNNTGTGTAEIQVYKNIDAPNLSLSAGVYILHFEIDLTGSDTIARKEPYDIVIFIPGTLNRVIYPTAADLQIFLVGSGLLSNPPTAAQQAGIDLDSAIYTAIAEWERRTKWMPFLSATQTRTYTPEGPYTGPLATFAGLGSLSLLSRGGSNFLFLKGGILGVTSVTMNKTGTDPGTVLTANSDYWLRPNNAPFSRRPFTHIEFGANQWGAPQSIEVIGIFGFCPSVAVTGYANLGMEEEVWRTILKMAAADLASNLAVLKTGGVTEFRQENVTRKYAGVHAYSGIAQMWTADVEKTVRRYMRKEVV